MKKKLKVLVVDDLPSLLRSTGRLFSTLGHEVQLADHPLEALQMYDEFKPDLVITDWEMPQMNGGELCAQLRAKGATAPIFIVSGLSRHNEAATCGATGCYLKPLSQNTLDEIIYLSAF